MFKRYARKVEVLFFKNVSHLKLVTFDDDLPLSQELDADNPPYYETSVKRQKCDAGAETTDTEYSDVFQGATLSFSQADAPDYSDVFQGATLSFPQDDAPDYSDVFQGATLSSPQVDAPDYSDVFQGATLSSPQANAPDYSDTLGGLLAPLPFYPDYTGFTPNWVSLGYF